MGIKGKNDRMVVLACEDCKERNYTTVKNKKNSKDRMELSKYCPTCKHHTTHKETKQPNFRQSEATAKLVTSIALE